MISCFAGSRLSLDALQKRADRLEALVLDPSAAESEEEILLAYHLAQKSSAGGSAIARKFKYEFLLWLSGKTDIKSAMAKSGPKDAKNVLVVMFGEEKSAVLAALEAKERKGALGRKGDALRLEEISLSRIRN